MLAQERRESVGGAGTPTDCAGETSMSTENSESQERIEWESIGRNQLARAIQHAFWELETDHNTLRSKIENGESVTPEDINELRKALNRYQNVLEKDVTRMSETDPFSGNAVDNIPPSALE